MKIPDIIMRELESCGLHWTIFPGKGSHAKLYICGRFVGVFALGNAKGNAGRGGMNVRSQIRRIAKQIKEEQ